MGRALWLPDRLRAFGVTVVEHPGWQQRGGSGFDPHAVIAHHTAGPAAGDAPSLAVCINGRPDLAGPLCQVLLARSGTAHIIASGRANHAGSGSWHGVTGNSHALGIEAENTGVGEPWPAVQLDAFHRCAAALLAGIGRDATWVCAHREWTPRKVDPAGIDMVAFRAAVAHLLDGPAAPPQEDDMPALPIARQSKPGTQYVVIGDKAIAMGSADQLRRLQAAGLVRAGDPVILPDAEFNAYFGTK